MTDSFTLPKREDNSTADAEKLVAWARGFKGVDAHIVFDYVRLEVPDRSGANAVPGALRGVTVQWDIDGDGVADKAVHVFPGGEIRRDGKGFEVVNPEPQIEPNSDVPKVSPELVAAVLAQLGVER